MEDVLAILLLFGGAIVVTLSFSPVGRALADRLRGDRADPGARQDRAEVLDAIDRLRREVSELAERVDFAERLLTRRTEPGTLPRGE